MTSSAWPPTIRSRRSSSSASALAPGRQDREQLNTDSVDWQNNLQLARNWSITAGVQSDYISFYENDNILGRILHGHETNVGGYISSQWQPIDGLNVLNSGRYDSYSAFKGAFSWRQGVTYLVAPTQTQLHASVAEAYTPPSIQDLYLSSALGPIIANPNLVHETDLGWEAGESQPFWDNRITASATYFHNDVHHDIEDVSTPLPGEPFAETTENVNHVVTEGVETSLTVQPLTNLTLNGSYTYLTAVNEDTHLFLLRRPRHTFNFTGTWNPDPAAHAHARRTLHHRPRRHRRHHRPAGRRARLLHPPRQRDLPDQQERLRLGPRRKHHRPQLPARARLPALPASPATAASNSHSDYSVAAAVPLPSVGPQRIKRCGAKNRSTSPHPATSAAGA